MGDSMSTAGIQIKYCTAGQHSANSFTALANIDALSEMPGVASTEKYEKHRIDQVTDPTQLAQWFKKFGYAFIDPGMLNLVLGMEKAKYNTALALSHVEKGWRIQFPDGSTPTNGSTIDFDGTIEKFQAKGSKSDEVKVDCAIQASGPATFTAAA